MSSTPPPSSDTLHIKPQDIQLPLNNVIHIMKSTLPPDAKISHDAKEMMQSCVSEFLAFIASEASDGCVQEKRRRIKGEDVVDALKRVGWEGYGEDAIKYMKEWKQASPSDMEP